MKTKSAIPVETLSICRWLAMTPEDLLRACKQARYQGSGPGGQKRNRVYSGVRLLHPESGLAIEADARRESRGNLEDALHRLRVALALQISGVTTVPGDSKESLEQDIEATPVFQSPKFRANASPNHVDFPLFALRAVYFLNKYRGQTSVAAQAVGCTGSALARFLKSDKALWVRARDIREANGLHPLK